MQDLEAARRKAGPESSSARRNAASGACGGGFSTTAFPAAIAGATLWATRFRGKLKGAMAAITPMGSAPPGPSCRRHGIGVRGNRAHAEAARLLRRLTEDQYRPVDLGEREGERLAGIPRDQARQRGALFPKQE